VVQHDVHREPVEPGGEGALAAVERQLVPGPDEDVLRQLLGERLVGDHPRAEGVDAPDVRPVQPLERPTVAAGRERDVTVGGRGAGSCGDAERRRDRRLLGRHRHRTGSDGRRGRKV
jgi:hypothetical protein